MRRTVIGAAVAAALALAGCERAGPGGFSGYVEGDLVFIGPTEAGRITALLVEEGAKVKTGQVLARVEDDLQTADRDAAAAQLREAEARLANARSPLQRPEEIAVLEASERRAAAALDLSRIELDRQKTLVPKGASSQANLDSAQHQYDQNLAALDEARRRISAARIASRNQDIEAAEQAVEAAKANLAAAQIRLDRRAVKAPADGPVQTVYYRPGEMVPEGRPIVSVLPPGLVKVRFFVPEAQLPKVAGGCSRHRHLRRLRAVHRKGVLHRGAGGIYPAGHLQPRGALQARLYGGSAARRSGQGEARPAGEREPRSHAVSTAAAPSSDPEVVIEVEGLSKSFGGRRVVDNLSMRVRRGQIYGFLGPNGSGKTTTIRMLCGLLTPDAGRGTCLGMDILTESRRIREHVGYMTQRFSLYQDLSVRENLEFVARLYGVPQPEAAATQALQRLGLEGRGRQLAGALSGGWKQRLALGACILPGPRPSPPGRAHRRRRSPGATGVLGADP